MKSLTESIEMYIAEKEPCYALQITGEWGIGKTYSINKILNNNMYYVSVFGLNTIDDVYASLFCSMYKNEKKEKIRSFIDKCENIKLSVTGVDIPLGSIANVLTKFMIKDIIRNDKPIVIDDIERSTIELEHIFGLVSNCLEKHGCNVILLMNEKAINTQKSNPLIEKTIGRKLTITANFKDAYQEFAKKHISKNLLIELEEDIIDLFIKLNCQSLRTLRRLLFEIDMIHKCLYNKNVSENKSIIKKGLIIFSTLSISLKQGIITTESLTKRPNYTDCYLASKDGDDKNSYTGYLSVYEKLNNEIDLELNILNDNVILDILKNGTFHITDINDSIIKYSEFKSGEIEPWMIIYKYYQYDDETVYKAIDSINSIFKNREEYDISYILHLVSAIYLIEKLFCDRLQIENTEEYINEYLDYLYKNTDCFLQTYPSILFNELFDNSYGYSYFSRGNKKFISIENKIKDKIKCFTNAKITNIGSNLNALIKHDLGDFFNFIKLKFKPNTIYTENPILKNIDKKTLCLALINNDYFFHEQIHRFFLNRYAQGQMINRLKEESPWFKDLIQELIDSNNNNSGISKIRIEGLIKRLEYLKD